MKPTRGLGVLVIALLLLAASCSGEGDGGFGSPVAPAPEATVTASAPSPSAAPSPVTVTVASPGNRYEPAELGLELGRPAVLELRNTDATAHTLTVNELSILLRAEPGETVRLPFTPGEAGEFAMYCSIPGHRDAGHEGVVRVR